MIASFGLVGCVAAILAASPPASAQSADTPVRPSPAAAPSRAQQPATVPPLQRIVSLHLRDVRLDASLDEIGRQAGIAVEYTARVVPVDRRVTVDLDSVTVAAALEAVLMGTAVHVLPARGGVMLVNFDPPSDTGVGSVLGHVTDSLSGKGVGGAVVTIADTAGAVLLALTTNDSGYFFFGQVPAGVRAVRVRHLAYFPAQLPVTVENGAGARLEFLLRPTPLQLQAVVVTATGPQRRLDLGNDVAILNADSIVKMEPISSVTQLLEGRVPGLEVQHTSGTPGDPSRIRLRGTSSAFSSNDPIVIVDGVRIFAAQSDSQSANLARSKLFPYNPLVAAPSALDQIDPNTIESIEVFKGPSAATMYGADAANGVIVITTKHGQPGPARWTMAASRAMTFQPGLYPLGTYRFGTNASGERVLCLLGDFSCRADSVVHFQALNDPAFTILGRGNATQLSLGVSGGVGALTYSVTGSAGQAQGLVKLPGLEAQQYQAQNGAPPPSWMQRPDQLSSWSGSSRLMARLNDRTDVSLSTSFTRETQQRSDLETQIATLMSTYVDADSLSFWRGTGANDFQPSNVLLPSFYTRATDEATNIVTSANLSWRPFGWLNVTADAGVNAISRTDQIFLPHGVMAADTAGDLTAADGSTMQSTVNLRASASLALPRGFRFQVAGGANYTKTSNADLSIEATNLVAGTASINGAGKIASPVETVNGVASFGWYLEPTITHRLFTVTTGLRIDGSSSFGTHVTLPAPKVGVSYLVSEEPWFPFKRAFDVLRVRAAYGQAGVWPGPTRQLRLYQSSEPWLGGGFVNVTTISTLGNTRIKPERSTEWEGGFDTDMLQDHLSVALTFYQKIRYDALMQVPVAPSVYGGGPFDNGVSVFKNIGEIRNTGFELSVTTQLARSSVLSWSGTLTLSQNRNMVVHLGPGVSPFQIGGGGITPGYPLFGYWATPILAYYDANHDGIITASEVRLGDTLVYMGSSEPKYQANAFTTISLFRGTVIATAGLSYQHAFTQLNQALTNGNVFFLSSFGDPSAPQSAQAATAVWRQTAYGLLETVSVLRLNSLSVSYSLPKGLARWIGAQNASLQLQGTNLGLWTNYRGKDPNVNAFTTGNGVADTGVLPMPRTWLLSVRAAY